MQLTDQQLSQQDREAKKIEEMKQMMQRKPAEQVPIKQETLPQVQKPMMMGLPNIGQRGGNFEIDKDYLRKANAELNKLAFEGEQQAQPVDTRTMQEVLRDKTTQNEKIIEEKKVESVEQRKARLLA